MSPKDLVSAGGVSAQQLAEIEAREHERRAQLRDSLATLANARRSEVWEMFNEQARDVAVLVEAVKGLQRVVVEISAPYVALQMDAESRRWIAPSIWEAMSKANGRAAAVLGTFDHQGGERPAP